LDLGKWLRTWRFMLLQCRKYALPQNNLKNFVRA
jgi:hypothetical protein